MVVLSANRSYPTVLMNTKDNEDKIGGLLTDSAYWRESRDSTRKGMA